MTSARCCSQYSASSWSHPTDHKLPVPSASSSGHLSSSRDCDRPSSEETHTLPALRGTLTMKRVGDSAPELGASAPYVTLRQGACGTGLDAALLIDADQHNGGRRVQVEALSPGTVIPGLPSRSVREARLRVGGSDLGVETFLDPVALTEQGQLTPSTRYRAQLSMPGNGPATDVGLAPPDSL
jgi:hypothetical protein